MICVKAQRARTKASVGSNRRSMIPRAVAAPAPPPPPERDPRRDLDSEETDDSWPSDRVVDVSNASDVKSTSDKDPDFCEVLSGVFNRGVGAGKKKDSDADGGFKRQGGKKVEVSQTINRWIDVVKKLQEEKARVEAEHTKTLDLLREALSETAKREADTLQSLVDRARGSAKEE